jgi:hypothetical protein
MIRVVLVLALLFVLTSCHGYTRQQGILTVATEPGDVPIALALLTLAAVVVWAAGLIAIIRWKE